MSLTRFGVPLSLAAFLQLVLTSGAWAQTPGGAGPPAAYPPPAAGAQPPPAAYPPPAAAPSPYPPGTMQAPFVPLVAGPVIMLRANHPRARLQQMQLKWRDICTVPCGIPADPSGMYRVGGGTIRPSDPFRLPRPTGEVFIDADVGSNVKHWVGFGLGLGGVGLAALGLLYLTAFSSTSNSAFDDTTTNVYKGVGIFYLITGGVLMAIGIPLWAGSNTSIQVR